MKTATAGWGTPGWLPPSVARRMALDDAQDAKRAREEQAEREQRAEERQQRLLATYQQEAAIRGEEVSVLDLAAGRVPGRTVGDVLQNALTASKRQDAVDAARVYRDGHGEPERLPVFFGEPSIIAPAARSESGWKVWRQTRRWQERREKQAEAEAARRALDTALEEGLVDGVTIRPRQDPILWLGAP